MAGRNKIMTELSVLISAQTEQLNKGIKDAQLKVQEFSKNVETQSKMMGDAFNELKGHLGPISEGFDSLNEKLGTMNPYLIGVGAAVGVVAAAWKDLNTYTETWEGKLSDAGVKLETIKMGLTEFWKLMSMERGEALGKKGIGGWIGTALQQVGDLAQLQTGRFGMTQTGIKYNIENALAEKAVELQNDWLKAKLEGIGEESRLNNLMAQQMVLMRGIYAEDDGHLLTLDEKNMAMAKFLDANDMYRNLQKDIAEKELSFLEQKKLMNKLTYEEETEEANLRAKLEYQIDTDWENNKKKVRKVEKENAKEEKERLKEIGEERDKQLKVEEKKLDILKEQVKTLKAAFVKGQQALMVGKGGASGHDINVKAIPTPASPTLGYADTGNFFLGRSKLDTTNFDDPNLPHNKVQKEIDLTELASQQLKNTIQEGLTSAAESLGEALAGVGDSMEPFTTKILKVLISFVGEMGKILISVGVGALALKKLMINPWTAIIAGIALVALSSAANAMLNKSLAKTEKGFATGGVSMGQFAMVGEQGRESVYLPRGSRVLSHSDTMQALSNSVNSNYGSIRIEPSTIKIKGSDLLIVFDEASRVKNNSL